MGGWGHLGDPQAPGDVAAGSRDAIKNRTDNEPYGCLTHKESGDADSEARIQRDAESKEVHPVKQASPNRAHDPAGRIRDDQGEPSDLRRAQSEAKARIAEVFYADGQHCKVGEPHQHPGHQRIPEHRVFSDEAKSLQGVEGSARIQCSGGDAPHCGSRSKVGEGKEGSHPTPTVGSEGKARRRVGGYQAAAEDLSANPRKDHGRCDADHEGAGIQSAPLVGRVIVVVNLGHQRDGAGRGKQGQHAPDGVHHRMR